MALLKPTDQDQSRSTQAIWILQSELAISEYQPDLEYSTDFALDSTMTSAQVVKTSVTTTDNGPSQDLAHPDGQTTLSDISILVK